MEEKLAQHDNASYTAQRHQLLCKLLSVSTRLLMVFARVLHAFKVVSVLVLEQNSILPL